MTKPSTAPTMLAPPQPAHEPTIPLVDLLERARTLQSQLDAVRPLYAELDALLLAILGVTATLAPNAAGAPLAILPDGTHVLLIDNFLDRDGAPKLTAWKSCGIRRYDLNFTDPTSAARSRKKASS